MTPPPVKRWRVSIDSPEVPKATYEVEAMVETEAKVRGAETALTVAASNPPLSPGLRKLSQEDAVTAIAGYATAEVIG